MGVGGDLASSEHVDASVQRRGLGVVLRFGQRGRAERMPRVDRVHGRRRSIGCVEAAEQHRSFSLQRRRREILECHGKLQR